jgi:hypothetical protein
MISFSVSGLARYRIVGVCVVFESAQSILSTSNVGTLRRAVFNAARPHARAHI